MSIKRSVRQGWRLINKVAATGYRYKLHAIGLLASWTRSECLDRNQTVLSGYHGCGTKARRH